MVNRNYTEDFQNNVKVSFEAEKIAKDLLEQLTWDTFITVRDDPKYFHVGDLLSSDGKGWDVKDDGVIHRTGNVFCETKKHWKYTGETTDGWMLNGKYDYLCVLDRIDKNIYVLDFNELKKVYKLYGYSRRGINMGDNYTDGFVLSLCKCRNLGLLIYEAHYEYDALLDYNFTN